MMDEVIVNTAGKTISKQAAVQLFGTDKQQEHFERYRKFTSKKTEQALIKTLEQRFESVEMVKSGRSMMYKLGGARTEIAERVDQRGKNNELSYSKHLDAVVLMALDNKLFKEHETTLINWVYNFGLVNEALYTLKKFGITSNATEDFRKELCKGGLIKSETHTAELREFLKDFDTKKDVLERTLIRMDKENLINFYKVPKVKLKTPLEFKSPNGKPYKVKALTISSTLENEITEKQRELREKYNLSPFHTFQENTENMNGELKEKVENYFQELRDFYAGKFYQDEFGGFHKIDIEYFWFNYAISVKATPTRIRKYLKKHRPNFYDEYITDNQLFFSSSQDNFAAERRKVLLQKAYDTSKTQQEKILEKHKESLGKIPYTDQKNLDYWENQFVENVKQIESRLKEDFQQGIKTFR